MVPPPELANLNHEFTSENPCKMEGEEASSKEMTGRHCPERQLCCLKEEKLNVSTEREFTVKGASWDPHITEL